MMLAGNDWFSALSEEIDGHQRFGGSCSPEFLPSDTCFLLVVTSSRRLPSVSEGQHFNHDSHQNTGVFKDEMA